MTQHKIIQYFCQFKSMFKFWRSIGLSEEINISINPSATSDNILNPRLDFIDNPKIKVAFDESCLKQNQVTFIP